jgi:hypothetical protein
MDEVRPGPRFWSNSAFAFSGCVGSVKRWTVVSAIDFAATIMPFIPIVLPAHAVACQLCGGTPGANVAPVIDTAGAAETPGWHHSPLRDP